MIASRMELEHSQIEFQKNPTTSTRFCMIFFKYNRSGDAVIVDPKKSKQPKGDKRKTLIVEKPPLTMREIIEKTHVALGFPRNSIEDSINCMLSTITTSLKDGQPVVIPGFGKFKPRKARSSGCRNPATGKKIKAPMRKSVSFRPSIALKNALVQTAS